VAQRVFRCAAASSFVVAPFAFSVWYAALSFAISACVSLNDLTPSVW